MIRLEILGLQLIVSLLLWRGAQAACGKCMDSNLVACHSQHVYSLCIDGVPTDSYITCPFGTVCTDHKFVCVLPFFESYETQCDIPKFKVKPSTCGVCGSEGRVFSCVDEKTIAFCYGGSNPVYSAVATCPEGTYCDVENSKNFCTPNKETLATCRPEEEQILAPLSTTTTGKATNPEDKGMCGETTTSTLPTTTSEASITTSTTAVPTTTTVSEETTTSTNTVPTTTTVSEETTTPVPTTSTVTKETTTSTTPAPTTTSEASTTTSTTPVPTTTTVSEETTTSQNPSTTSTAAATTTTVSEETTTSTTPVPTTTTTTTTPVPTTTTTTTPVPTTTTTFRPSTTTTVITQEMSCKAVGSYGFAPNPEDPTCQTFIYCVQQGGKWIISERQCEDSYPYYHPYKKVCVAHKPAGCA